MGNDSFFYVIFDNKRRFKSIFCYYRCMNKAWKKTQMSIFISSYFLLKDTLWHYSRCIPASKCRMQSNHKARVVIVREHTWYG